MPLTFSITKAYPLDIASDCWRGVMIDDPVEFDIYLRGPVWKRVTDSAFEDDFAADLNALTTAEMDTSVLTALLQAANPPLDWEVGEAMAECLLEDELNAVWPWNENRDKKTPKASLPGADIVGFLGDGDETIFLFGEVKTSSHADNPPGVMSGRSGLAHQIDTLADDREIHRTLIQWLFARCRSVPHFKARYDMALKRYLQSDGTDFAIVGVLLRDTAPHADDLRTRGTKLDGLPVGPRRRLDAWYTPRAISDWVRIAEAAS
ncbi:hypothetical protein [Devosia chinhatensis]|nr:hypothetical protein [Devosia chinhatensis]